MTDGKRLKAVAQLIAGQSPSSDDVHDLEDGMPFIQGNAEFGSRHPTPRLECDVAQKVANPGDLLLSVRAPVGALNTANQRIGIGRGVCAIRAIASDGRYLWWWLHSQAGELEAVATGTTFKAVSTGQVGNLWVPTTDTAQQRLIAAILDRETAQIDAMIDAQQRLVDALRERRQAATARTMTEGLLGDALRSTGIDQIPTVPSGWDVVPLKRCLVRNDGGVWGEDPDSGSDTFFVLRSTEQTADGRWRIDAPAERVLSAKERRASRLTVGDLLVTKSSGSSLHIGKTTIVDEQVAGMSFSNFMQRLTPSDGLLPAFAWYLLNNHLVRQQFDILSRSVTGLANLTGGIIGEVVVPLPPVSEQAHIVDYLDRATSQTDAMVAGAESSISLLRERRAAVVTAAVTGRLDPRTGVERVDEVLEGASL
ncbi:MAG: restriction endonuclease subunit S [Actinobacteria bacterium]|nr:restriction endonuclease subunit S [Actinomycetota bacterium]